MENFNIVAMALVNYLNWVNLVWFMINSPTNPLFLFAVYIYPPEEIIVEDEGPVLDLSQAKKEQKF